LKPSTACCAWQQQMAGEQKKQLHSSLFWRIYFTNSKSDSSLLVFANTNNQRYFQCVVISYVAARRYPDTKLLKQAESLSLVPKPRQFSWSPHSIMTSGESYIVLLV
jgi:hypothetical protein